MIKHPKTIVVDGESFDLMHLFPWEVKLNIPAKDKHPELEATVFFRFSNHCYTESVPPNECDPTPLIKDHNGFRRQFCKKRYSHSIGLRDILEAIHTRKCLFTGRNNWLIIELKNDNGNTVNYHVYFSIKRHRTQNNAVIIWIESAYIKDKGTNAPKRGYGHDRIHFAMLVRKILKGEPIRRPPKR